MRDGFGNASDQSQGQTQSQSNGGSGLTVAAKAGIAVALIGGILLGLLLAIGISYWKKKRQSKSRGDTSERMEGGDSAVQVLETRQCESDNMLQYYRALMFHLAGVVFP